MTFQARAPNRDLLPGELFHPAKSDPVRATALSDQSAMTSRRFIARFEARDLDPIEVVDDTTARARDRQIIALTKRICAKQTVGATNAQVLRLHRDFMRGFF